MKILNRKISIVISLIVVLMIFLPYNYDLSSDAALSGEILSSASYVYFREAPNGTPIKDGSGNTIYLHGGHKLSVLDTTNSSWYKVKLEYSGKSYTGYVASQFITILGEESEETPSQPSGDTDFEAKLSNEGFPESYKVMLRELHAKYPNWEFKAVQTGIDWGTLLENETNKPGQIKNLVQGVSSNPHYNWRSTSVGYDYKNDKWSSFDGSTWFAASDELVAYYLDPRTYLYENYIFVFESLSYQQGMQNETGVEAILKGTFMSNTVPQGETQTYAQIILNAASASGVSPYHIASRIRLEMGVNGGVCAFGNSSSYPGIYNYFNIGAYDSADGSAADKGLAWAASSGSYGRPWNTVSKAITGGSQFIGASYIGVGQDTLYTQKFNVTNKGSLFSHQYMTNVQAPAVECLTNYNAYANNNLLNSTMVFKIPVYSNMPAQAVTKPADSGNPNNWLSSLSISGYSLTPSFAVNMTTDYSLIVSENIESVTISATPVNSHARVSGTGTINLAPGTNRINIVVTAQSGSTRTYKLTIVRGDASAGDTCVNPGSRGDLNGDGNISAIDIVKIQRIIVGLDPLTDEAKSVGDLNNDGTVSAIDIVYIQRHIVGIELIQ